MEVINPNAPSSQHCHATLFYRHRRRLRAVLSDGQGWFCLADLSRLMGRAIDERATMKLDPDQRRTAWVESHEHWQKCILVSESGVFALLVHHYVPENRRLRQWLTHEVLPELHQRGDDAGLLPSINSLDWLGSSLQVLHWRNEDWVRWRDMPGVLVEKPWAARCGFWRRVFGWSGR